MPFETRRLSLLGRRAVDPAQARDAKAKAFLTVPLYKTLFENNKGGVLPPAAALKREMVLIGVAEKQKHTARLVFERSAQYVGFFEHGKDRLVMPGIAPGDPPPKPDETDRNRGNRRLRKWRKAQASIYRRAFKDVARSRLG